VRITLPSGTRAELVRPEGTPRRGLVIAPDMGGLRVLFDDLAESIATERGWSVCAVEPFPGREHLSIDERREVMRTLDDERQVGDLLAAADALAAEPVGLLGFCMGGMYTFKAAARGRFDRACAFYGMIRVPAGWRGPGQHEPLDLLAGPARCPTLAIVGTEDPYTPPQDVDALEAVGVEVARYPGAAHGFAHDASRPAYRPTDAADAWARAFAFLGS
jgi:carboxymethylenebutenolidase